MNVVEQRFLAPKGFDLSAKPCQSGHGFGIAFVAAAALVIGAGAVARQSSRKVSGHSSSAVTCRAHYHENGVPSAEAVNPVDELMAAFEGTAKNALAGAAGLAVLASAADPASAFPAFAQQKFNNPVQPNGTFVCANCHLGHKMIVIRGPHDVLPDTIFKVQIKAPAKFDKRQQPLGNGELGYMNVGAIVEMPEGWVLPPRDRLPKDLKKEMKGLNWAPYSKAFPNIMVAGPMPGQNFENMVIPVLAPTPDGKDILFGKQEYKIGVNRGRGQVYPDGSTSNCNVYLSPVEGGIKEIIEKNNDGVKSYTINIESPKGVVAVEVGAGADVVVEVGDRVSKDMQLTTDPNVGGWAQDERDIVLQDINRVSAVQGVMISFFFAQIAFVLKKKQFEKVQLAEGF